MKFTRSKNKIKSIGKRILGTLIELWFITLKPKFDDAVDRIVDMILSIPSVSIHVLIRVYEIIFLPIIIMIDDMFEKVGNTKTVKRIKTDFKINKIIMMNRFKYFKIRKKKHVRIRERKRIDPEVSSAVSILVVIVITMAVMSWCDLNNNNKYINEVNNSVNDEFIEETTIHQMRKYGIDNQSITTISSPNIVTEMTTTTTTVVTEEETVIVEEEEVITETEPIQTEQVIEEHQIEHPISDVINDDTINDLSSMTLLGNLRITGYVATGNRTANGEIPYVGGVAINRSYGLPYGTKIYIDGMGYFVINDTGCKTGVVDVFCNTVAECYALTSYADIYIVN